MDPRNTLCTKRKGNKGDRQEGEAYSKNRTILFILPSELIVGDFGPSLDLPALEMP
jgi:hypothetical protein